MKQKAKPCFIIALNCETIEGDIRALNTYGFDKFKRLIGSWNGKLENSYLVIDTDKTHIRIKGLLRYFKQEAALYLDEDSFTADFSGVGQHFD